MSFCVNAVCVCFCVCGVCVCLCVVVCVCCVVHMCGHTYQCARVCVLQYLLCVYHEKMRSWCVHTCTCNVQSTCTNITSQGVSSAMLHTSEA